MNGNSTAIAAQEQKEFLKTVGLFGTGITVISTMGETGPHGMTANAVTSLSLDPMLVVFCAARKSAIAAFLKKGARFTINILRHDQEAISNHFAGFRKDGQIPSFRFVEWECGPRIEGVLAAIGCEVYDTPDGGDHTIVIGRVLALHHGIQPHKPLIYFASRYRRLADEAGTPAPDRMDLGGEAQLFMDPWEG